MPNQQLIECWKAEENELFAGWNFSYLKGRMSEDDPPWSYTDRAMELMRSAASVLDIGTVGGERMLITSGARLKDIEFNNRKRYKAIVLR